MKIGIDINSVIDRPTGIGYYAKNLLRALKGIDSQNQYIAYAPPAKKDMNTIERMIWENHGLRRAAAKERLDLLHVPGFAPPLNIGCKVVTTVHDLIGLIYSKEMGAISRFYWARWLPMAIRRSDLIIADSENTKKDILRYVRFPEDRIRVIYLAQAPAYRRIEDTQRLLQVREKYGLKDDFILFVGTIEPRKNLISVLKAYDELIRSKVTDKRFVIVGKSGWGEGPIHDYIREEGLTDYISFLGFIDEDDLAALYSICSLFVYVPFYEGFGLPPLEAMACGAPVITSSTSSVPEIVSDAAITVAPDDIDAIVEAMRQVLVNPDMQRQLREKGLARAKTFSWEKVAKEVLEVYDKAVAA